MQYFVRYAGRTLGPMSLDDLRQRFARREITRLHAVSTDQKQWQRIYELPTLLQIDPETEATIQASPAQPDNEIAEPETKESTSLVRFDHFIADDTVWFYAEGQQEVGPLQPQAFKQKIIDGTITNQTLIWREGLPDWQTWQDYITTPTNHPPQNKLKEPHSGNNPNHAESEPQSGKGSGNNTNNPTHNQQNPTQPESKTTRILESLYTSPDDVPFLRLGHIIRRMVWLSLLFPPLIAMPIILAMTGPIIERKDKTITAWTNLQKALLYTATITVIIIDSAILGYIILLAM